MTHTRIYCCCFFIRNLCEFSRIRSQVNNVQVFGNVSHVLIVTQRCLAFLIVEIDLPLLAAKQTV